ncbi:MAG: glycosyltransferase [Acetobacteraceae bacterium]|jgi:hopene-associated glycosyltransferase HpnB
MTTLAVLSLLIWLYLLLAHGRFWQSDPELAPEHPVAAPPVTVVVPARDEAPLIGQSLRSLLAQEYPGKLRVVAVDDGSSDGTGTIARSFDRVVVVSGAARPPGWSGKLWAVAQGLAEADASDLVLLTDADIVHAPHHVATLVAQMERGDFDLVSEMVTLACDTSAEHALVPAFVFFFQLLYPFAWVNDPLRATAAAAGGTLLIRPRALQRIGGIAAVRGALIDDVALAAAVKRGGRIWLGHSRLARSIRSYPAVADIWRMVSRSAYVQLRFSPVLLLGTAAAMTATFLAPPLVALFGHGAGRWFGWLTWGAMAAAFQPTLRRYHRSVLWAPCLPVVAAFYLAATIGSAVNHYLGRGVAWKGRAYQGAGV